MTTAPVEFSYGSSSASYSTKTSTSTLSYTKTSAATTYRYTNYPYIMIVTGTGDGGYTATVVGSGDSSTRMIYVNEEYHALIVNGNFISIPHADDDGDGYCDVCNEYVGTDEETEVEYDVVTVDGEYYYEVFSSDVSLSANNWATVTLGDSSFATALAYEGAILEVIRDTETLVSYIDGVVWDKFGISSGSNYVFLATSGTTAEDETGLVAHTSDDGYTVTYDGATVYAALESASIASASSYSLTTNSSESYTITSVRVLVPVGAIATGVVTEDVDVTEPAEEGDTTTEEDGADEVDVGDVDTGSEEAESNPTTGVALALVPMAIAGFAVIASKRKN